MDGREGIADAATRLVQDLRHNPNIIPPYDANLMRQCVDTLNRLYEHNAKTMLEIREGRLDGSDPQVVTQREQRMAAIIYIWRCTTAYVHERACRIRALRMQFGGILPVKIKNHLSEAEIEFFNEYSGALADFQSSLGEAGVDLMANTEPPKNLFVQVRVKEDYGEFETSDGNVVILHKNSLHSLPHQDCEILIRRGILEIVNS